MFHRNEAYSIAKRCSPPFVRLRLAAGVRALLAAAAVAALSLVNVSASAIQLPADEADLAELLSAGVIDTLEYEHLLAFYALPLSVPQGELGYLALAFPDIADMIPIDPEEISTYQPFDNRQIRRLFNDYPALADFEPVLRFNAAPSESGTGGEVVVGINRSSVDALKGHRVRFRRKGGLLSAEGGAALSDSAAMWQSRRLGVSHKGVSAHIGNFKQPMPGELTWGRFATLPSLMKLTDGKTGEVAANWLYGGSGAWNGVSVDAREIWGAKAFAVGAAAFCHLRPAEAGWGVGADIRAGKRARVFAGITGFRLGVETADVGAETDYGVYGDDAVGVIGMNIEPAPAVDAKMGVVNNVVNNMYAVNNKESGDADRSGKDVVANEYYYAHLYTEYNVKGVRAVAEAAAPLAGESFAPALSLRLNYSVKGSSAEYHAVFYPEDFAAPMSRLKKQLLAEVGEKEPPPSSYTQPSPPVQKHAVRMTVPFISDAVKLIPELDFASSGGVKRIHGQAEARMRVGGADIAAKHAAKIFTTGADSVLHTTSASINYQTAYPLSARASFQSAYGYYKNPRRTYTLEAPTTVIPSAVITPYVRGKHASAGEYWLGIKSEFHLYKKTWTGVTLEIPVNVKGADNVYVKASSSYSF